MAYKDPVKNREAVRKWRAANPGASRAHQRRSVHGYDIDDWFARAWDEQHGCCYLCGREMKLEARQEESACIDHDHGCCPDGKSCQYCRRGLACNRCNKVLGFVDDDVELLRYIADSFEQKATVQAGVVSV